MCCEKTYMCSTYEIIFRLAKITALRFVILASAGHGGVQKAKSLPIPEPLLSA